ncbi:MAG: YkgJ family cysteine cluster protein [Candidatus Hodarchaeales archaeon]
MDQFLIQFRNKLQNYCKRCEILPFKCCNLKMMSIYFINEQEVLLIFDDLKEVQDLSDGTYKTGNYIDHTPCPKYDPKNGICTIFNEIRPDACYSFPIYGNLLFNSIFYNEKCPYIVENLDEIERKVIKKGYNFLPDSPKY